MRSSSNSVTTRPPSLPRAPRSRHSNASLLCLTSIVLLCSSGCATAPSSPPQIFCPTPPAYTKDFEGKVAGEIAAHPDLDATVKELEDYTKLRDQLAACNATPKAP